MKLKYPNLFKPLKIGGLILKNRMEVAPHSLEDFTEREYTPRGWIEYYERRAAGGAAIVTVGETPVLSTTGPTQHHMLAIDDPDIMPHLAKVADAIHQHGAYASIELSHGGAGSMRMFLHGHKSIAPSKCICKFDGEESEEMTEEMIWEVIEAFGNAAHTLQVCGFDMCMIHAGHGWLLGQFLSQLTNRRTDQWGGSYDNRVRIVIEIIKDIKKKCGKNFPVEVRISGTENCEGGYTLEDGIELCKRLDGIADLLHISIGSINGYNPNGGSTITTPSPYEKRGRNVYLAEEIKKHVTQTPIVTLGSLVDPDMMEDILAAGKADMVAAARTFIADPDFAKKALRGKDDEIRPCLRCLGCLDATIMKPQVMRCAVNPEAGREIEYCYRQKVSEERRRVLIIGGGPAGMQAALTASKQGHQVMLCEKSGELGGALKYNKDVPFKDDMERYRQWLIRMVGKAPVEVRLNTAVTPEMVASLDPDTVICAIGAEPAVPKIPGIESKNVLLATEIHEKDVVIGKNVVVIGAGLVGCESGIWLSMQGSNVTLLELGERIIPTEKAIVDEGDITELREYIDINLRKANVKQHFNICVDKIDGKTVYATDTTGEAYTFTADTVVIAAGMRPLEEEREALRSVCLDFKPVGDCFKVGRIMEATASGYAAGHYID